MGNNNLKGWEKFLKERIKVVFDDGSKVTIKYGNLLSISNDFLFLLTQDGEEAVNINKIIRVEKC